MLEAAVPAARSLWRARLAAGSGLHRARSARRRRYLGETRAPASGWELEEKKGTALIRQPTQAQARCLEASSHLSPCIWRVRAPSSR